MKDLAILVYLLVLIVFALIGYAIMQLKLAGMNVKDFWSFIEANQTLDKLYIFSKNYEQITLQEQILYLKEAEKIFVAFDKVPGVLWEDEYEKYSTVLERYRDIKLTRWYSNN